MKFSILSLFPDYFRGPFDVSMIKRAKEKKLVSIDLVDIRDYAQDKHKTVDDRPFGGGPGMVLKAPPLLEAIRDKKASKTHVVYLSPQGIPLTAKKCRELSQHSDLMIICGHYEGIDERVIDLEVDEEISIGDFVLTSGAPAAIVLVDSVARFIPGVLGNPDGSSEDSYEKGYFDHPHYTRPRNVEGLEAPDVLMNGNHEDINRWRKAQAVTKTKKVRPELLDEKVILEEDKEKV